MAGPNYFIAGLILAIMILPIVSAISREVIATVPFEHKEAALALGATRWEMIRIAVLPYSRPGITGGAMLGLGRAIGETIAVVLVIGNSPKIGEQIFNQGYTLSAVIANEFGEAAATPVYQLGAVRRRAGAVRPDADRQHHRAALRRPRDDAASAWPVTSSPPETAAAGERRHDPARHRSAAGAGAPTG